MEKSVFLGVRKKKPIKRNKKKKFVKKLVDYLKSDCYLFGPVISSPLSDLSAPKMPCSAAAGVESEKPIKEKRKGLLEEIWKYSKSDSYMYGSLMVPQSSHVLGTKIRSPFSGPFMSISTRKTTKKSNQPTVKPANVIPANKPSKDRSSELGIASGNIIGHRETGTRFIKLVAHCPYQEKGCWNFKRGSPLWSKFKIVRDILLYFVYILNKSPRLFVHI